MRTMTRIVVLISVVVVVIVMMMMEKAKELGDATGSVQQTAALKEKMKRRRPSRGGGDS